MIQLSHFWVFIQDTETLIWKDICTPMFIMALFTIAKWKQPKYPSTDEWIKKLWYMCIYICIYMLPKRWNLAISNNVGETWGYYAKCSKSEGERQILYGFTHTWNIKNKNKINGQIKPSKNKHIDTQNRVVVTREEKN